MKARKREITKRCTVTQIILVLILPKFKDSQKKHCLGNSREWGTPVTIPNTEVKSLFADDTHIINKGKVGRCQDSAF